VERGELTLPASGSSYELTVPAATFAQDAETGEVAIDPGMVTVVVTGIIGGVNP